MRGKSGEMERGVPRRRRPRPVVTEGVEALLLRGDELAKGWLLALVEDAPLESAAAIMAGDVARDGPRIELARTDPDLLADAGERLSLVAGLVRAAVLRRHAESEPGGASRPRVPPLRVARTDGASALREGAPADGPSARRQEGGATPGHEGTVGPDGAGGGDGRSFENGGGMKGEEDGGAA
jgi:hypothetical protein